MVLYFHHEQNKKKNQYYIKAIKLWAQIHYYKWLFSTYKESIDQTSSAACFI